MVYLTTLKPLKMKRYGEDKLDLVLLKTALLL